MSLSIVSTAATSDGLDSYHWLTIYFSLRVIDTMAVCNSSCFNAIIAFTTKKKGWRYRNLQR